MAPSPLSARPPRRRLQGIVARAFSVVLCVSLAFFAVPAGVAFADNGLGGGLDTRFDSTPPRTAGSNTPTTNTSAIDILTIDTLTIDTLSAGVLGVPDDRELEDVLHAVCAYERESIDFAAAKPETLTRVMALGRLDRWSGENVLSADEAAKYFLSLEAALRGVLWENGGWVAGGDEPMGNAALILTLRAIGADGLQLDDFGDPESKAEWTLLTPFSDMDVVEAQGARGVARVLLALDSMGWYGSGFPIPDLPEGAKGEQARRGDKMDGIVKWLLDDHLRGGGWAADSGSGDETIDIETTALALQALAPYYLQEQRDREEDIVQSVVDDGLRALFEAQDRDSASFGSVYLDAQAIIALSALQIDLDRKDFVADGERTLYDALMDAYVDVGTDPRGVARGAFRADRSDPKGFVDARATDWAMCALVAQLRYSWGISAFYNMSDGDKLRYNRPRPDPDKDSGAIPDPQTPTTGSRVESETGSSAVVGRFGGVRSNTGTASGSTSTDTGSALVDAGGDALAGSGGEVADSPSPSASMPDLAKEAQRDAGGLPFVVILVGGCLLAVAGVMVAGRLLMNNRSRATQRARGGKASGGSS
jgi:hypothetical protein